MHITPARTFRQDQRFVSRNSKEYGERVYNLIGKLHLLLLETTIYWKMSTKHAKMDFIRAPVFLDVLEYLKIMLFGFKY